MEVNDLIAIHCRENEEEDNRFPGKRPFPPPPHPSSLDNGATMLRRNLPPSHHPQQYSSMFHGINPHQNVTQAQPQAQPQQPYQSIVDQQYHYHHNQQQQHQQLLHHQQHGYHHQQQSHQPLPPHHRGSLDKAPREAQRLNLKNNNNNTGNIIFTTSTTTTATRRGDGAAEPGVGAENIPQSGTNTEYAAAQQLSQLQNTNQNAMDTQSIVVSNQTIHSNIVGNRITLIDSERGAQRRRRKNPPNCVKCSKPAPVGFRYRVEDSPGDFYCKTCYNVKNKRFKKDTCMFCHITKESLTWFKSKKTKGATLCQKCYTAEMNARAITCSNCHSNKTTNAWVRSKKDKTKYLCQHCYRKEKGRTPSKCGECNCEMLDWRKSKLQKSTHLCRKCFEKEQEVIKKKQCSACDGKLDPVNLRKSKKDKSKYFCNKCYVKELNVMSNKQCGKCGTKDSTRSWNKSRTNPGVDYCTKCYYKERVELKKAKKQEEALAAILAINATGAMQAGTGGVEAGGNREQVENATATSNCGGRNASNMK